MMLRASFSRARPALLAIAPATRPQWRVAQRGFADSKKIDETSIPNPEPLATPSNGGPSRLDTIAPSEVPLTPPKPNTTPKAAPKAAPAPASRSAPAVAPATTPPTGTGSARVAPGPQAPKPKRRRFARALLWLAVLSALGYGGGVWYSLVSDSFHDFFTEYVPFGEDAVGYFEEREFRRRFPGRVVRTNPDDSAITIPSNSGLGARVAAVEEPTLAPKGPHVSAVEAESPAAAEHKAPKVASNAPATSPVEEKKVEPKVEPKVEIKEVAPVTEVPEAPAHTVARIDHLNVPSAGEPVVQDVVKIVNDLITAINADSAHGGKYDSALEKAKSELGRVVSDINQLKDNLERSSEAKIQSVHSEFDSAAKELVRRMEVEMQDQETRWKEEYENERERLSGAYKDKIHTELDVAQQVYEQRLKNELLEQSITLQKQFASAVRDRVEGERNGRLGKLNELSSSVQELEQLTADWNSVVDANLKTQHLVVAVDAVKYALESQTTPKPFITELAALKEIAENDAVVNAAIASINPVAYQRGIPNAGQLIDRFRRVAQEVRKAALLPEDAGVASHLASLAMSKVLFKKSGLAVGGDVEAVLARTEVLLEEGDLDGAAREMNGLQGWAKVLSKDWLGDVRRVLEVRQALDVITTEARLQTLLVD